MPWRITTELPRGTHLNRCAVCYCVHPGERYMDGVIEDAESWPICLRCFEEGARLIGFVPKSEVVVLINHDHEDWNAEWQRVEAFAEALVDKLVTQEERNG